MSLCNIASFGVIANMRGGDKLRIHCLMKIANLNCEICGMIQLFE